MIPGLKTFAGYSGFLGKNTSDPLTAMDPRYLLTAKNVVIEGDGVVRIRPGYSLVTTLAGDIRGQYYFQRDSDQGRFALINRGTNLTALNLNTLIETSLKSAESGSSYFDFTNNYFAAYAGDGNHAYKIVDNAASFAVYQHGITEPSNTPTIATGAGALTLTYGRQYVYCYVSYITDAGGNQRMHISAPSPTSAHTGPLTAKVITVGGMTASADPQVTHKWVFATMDSTLDSTSAFYFLAEITNATTSYGDAIADSALDTTRLAPFDNFAAPLGTIYTTYQNRVVIASGNKVYASGYEEIDLGIPQEAFPADLFFELPENVTALAVVDEGATLMLATAQAWYMVRGYDAQTFTKRDRVITPGAAGKRCVVITPTHMAWLSPDKKLYAWQSGSMPIEISASIARPLNGTYSMSDLTDANLSIAQLKWYSFGRHNYLILAANTSDQGTSALNWLAMWYVNIKDGAISGLAQVDFLPTDLPASIEVVKIGSTQWLYLGNSTNGEICRWPDGYQDKSSGITASFSPAWIGDATTKRYFWTDVVGGRNDTDLGTTIGVVVADAPDMTLSPTGLTVTPVNSPYGQTGTCARGDMQIQAGTTIGKWMRPVVTLPNDADTGSIHNVSVSYKPLYLQAP
jgi:hypothetical protein